MNNRKHILLQKGFTFMYNVVWFKRDLRTRDHLPLKSAIESGLPIIPILLLEPIQAMQPEHDLRHQNFLLQCAFELQQKIPLQILFLDALQAFRLIAKKYPIHGVYSYAETGLAWTYQRDKDVNHFFQSNNIQWFEYPYAGVERARKNRSSWDQRWRSIMQMPMDQPDFAHALWAVEKSGSFIPESFFKSQSTLLQKGGELVAQKRLQQFLENNIYKNYQTHISKPTESRDSCSRLSPYLAWGALSTREVYQSAMDLYQSESSSKRPLQAFISRLHWHCHFYPEV
jgi:deoxyribodipyrimidine photo-lyase